MNGNACSKRSRSPRNAGSRQATARSLDTQRAQRMESPGQLAGGIAHDLNNVLGAILGLASAHLMDPPGTTAADRAFETIAKAAFRGRKMVEQLLRYARQVPAEDRDLSLNTLIQEEVALLEGTLLSRIHLQLDLEPGLRTIRGDASNLANALLNLCVNAGDAMLESGTLTLRTRNLDDGWVEVQVEDTGSGMTEAVLRLEDGAWREEIVRRGCRNLERFTEERMAEDYLSLYASLIPT